MSGRGKPKITFGLCRNPAARGRSYPDMVLSIGGVRLPVGSYSVSFPRPQQCQPRPAPPAAPPGINHLGNSGKLSLPPEPQSLPEEREPPENIIFACGNDERVEDTLPPRDPDVSSSAALPPGRLADDSTISITLEQKTEILPHEEPEAPGDMYYVDIPQDLSALAASNSNICQLSLLESERVPFFPDSIDESSSSSESNNDADSGVVEVPLSASVQDSFYFEPVYKDEEGNIEEIDSEMPDREEETKKKKKKMSSRKLSISDSKVKDVPADCDFASLSSKADSNFDCDDDPVDNEDGENDNEPVPESEESYFVEKILIVSYRLRKDDKEKGRFRPLTRFFVKWWNWDNEYNSWVTEEDMGSEGELIIALKANMKKTLKRLNCMKQADSCVGRKSRSEDVESPFILWTDDIDDEDKVALSLLHDVTYADSAPSNN